MAINNPYLADQASAITNQANQNLMNYQLPAINSGAIAAGGFGGSRQGVAQGLAIGQTNQGITNSLANLYGSAYESDQNRATQQAMQQAALQSQQQIASMQDATQRYGLGNSYNLGMAGIGLQDKSLDINNYNTNRQLDLSQMGLGANLANTANLGLGAQGQQLYQAGYQQQQAPYQAIGQYANLLSPFTGLNQSQSQSTPGPSAIGSAAGGAITAAQLWQLLSKGFGG